MLRTVHLHGSLRKRFGGPFQLDIETPREASQALAAQLPGFFEVMRAGNFRVRLGPVAGAARSVTNGTVAMRMGRHTRLHIWPAAEGGKKTGTAKLVLGVVLIGVGLVGGLAVGAGLGSAAVTFGSGATAMSITWGQIALWGAGLAFSGLSSIISPAPEVGRYENREAAEDRPNFVFNGGVNNVMEGGAVAWVFGKRVRRGSSVVGAGLFAEQIVHTNDRTLAETTATFTLSATGVVGAKAKKKKQKPPEELPDTLQSKSVARIIDVVGEGQLRLCNGLRSVYLDDTPVENEDGSRNVQGYNLQWLPGLPDQDPITGMDGVPTYTGVGVVAEFGTPVVRTITALDATSLLVTVRTPNGMFSFGSDGDVGGADLNYEFEVRENGGSYQSAVKVEKFFGKAAAGWEITHRIKLNPGTGPWDLRFSRLVADDVDSTRETTTMFAGYTTINDVRLNYPWSCIAYSEIDSQEFGGDIAARTFDVCRVDAPIPSNYDPDTRTYTGMWDGTFKTGCTDNPAMAIWDLMTNDRFGAGSDIPPDLVNKWTLYTIAQRCDEMVSDGRGGLQPRYTFNGSLETREDAGAVFTTLASTFDAMAYWGAGAVIVTQDAPKNPVKLVNQTNVIKRDAPFEYEGTAARARHSQIAVTWNDPEDNFKPAIAYRTNRAQQHRFGLRQRDVYKWGCIFEGEAHRFARRISLTEELQSQAVTYQASLDHADLSPGDIIKLADPDYQGWRGGGKIVTCTTTTVTLDEAVTLEVGETYEISVTGEDGKPVDRAVTNAPGTTSVLTVTPALPATLPIDGAVWVLTATNIEPRQFMVLANRWVEKNIFQIDAAEFAPDKFAIEDQGIQLPPRNTSLLPSGPIAPPFNLGARDYIYKSGLTPRVGAIISAEMPNDARVVGLEFGVQQPGAVDYVVQPAQFGPTLTILDIKPGPYSFRARVYGRNGLRSQWSSVLNIALVELDKPPADVMALRLALQGNQVHLTWDAVTSLGLSHYRIRHSTLMVGATWSNALDLAPEVLGTQADLPAIGGTYFIKAVNAQLVESNNAALVTLDGASLQTINIIETLQESPDWTGTRSNLTISPLHQLQLQGDVLQNWTALTAIQSMALGMGTSVAEQGIYQIAEPFDLGAVYLSRVSAQINAQGANWQDTMSTWPNLADLAALTGVGPDDWQVKLQIRTTNDDPGGSPVWSDWSDLVVGTYSFRAADFRLIVRRNIPDGQVYVNGLAIVIDMEDRVIKFKAAVIPGAGLVFSFDPPFRDVPVLQFTPADFQTGDFWEITAESKSAATIRTKNSAGTGVQRTGDLTATGYGIEA